MSRSYILKKCFKHCTQKYKIYQQLKVWRIYCEIVSKNLNATLKKVLALACIELWTYPPAQEPEAAPPFSIHSADVKQVPFR